MATLLMEFELELCAESEGWSEQKIFALWIKKPLMVKASPRVSPRGKTMGM